MMNPSESNLEVTKKLSIYSPPQPGRFEGARPMVVIIPSTKMTDLAGNGAEYGVQNSMEDLSQEFNARGFATFRFIPREKTYSTKEGLQDVLAQYEAALQFSEVDPGQVLLLGFADGADSIARNFYTYWQVQRPLACVLLSSTVHTLHLNSMTCPYLVIHGSQDPILQSSLPYLNIESAIHHHQSRYGDVTANLCFPELGKELGEGQLAHDVIEHIVNWAEKAVTTGFRKQEPPAQNAIPRKSVA
ncbi:MAG: hypothetical protein H7222_11820 [Methylotenera sp.]|nr:hypothetical protein [Oligoflexia bacterium]